MCKVYLSLFLLTASNLFAQSITPKEIMGTWKVNQVSISETANALPEKAQELKEVFEGASFVFKGNGVFELVLQNTRSQIATVFNEFNNTNWILKENSIHIGYESSIYSYMRIQVDQGSTTLFKLPMIQLEVTKTADAKPKKFKKLKSKYPKRKALNSLVKPVFKTKEFNEDAIVPYALVDTPPLIGDCIVTSDPEEMKACTSQKISRFVNRKFNTEIASNINFSGKAVTKVTFIIGVDGNIYNIEATSTQPEFEEEGKRVIGLLPNFTPAKQEGIPVAVSYTLPITFMVAN